jgi:Holliday junction resolvase RusA-like endonuclease
MLPFEFVVYGTPRSFRSHSRPALIEWMSTVKAAASARWPSETPPLRGKVRVVVTYYHEGEIARLDNDNMVKPVLDALTGLIYFDDRQASSIEVRSVNMDLGLRMAHVSVLLAEAFVTKGEFLHVRVEEDR